jgi:ferredoxin--NADP+ reductase
VDPNRFQILQNQALAKDVHRLRIRAPRVARRQQPGQFVIVRVHEQGERIPLTIADSDPEAETIDLIVQGVGKTTRLMNSRGVGEALLDVAGPLGQPSQIENFGTVVVVSGGVGTAIVYPTARALSRAGNHVVSILGARTAALMILEAELRGVSDEFYAMTDDGSRGEKGLVTERLARLLEGGRRPDHVFAVGPIPMMRAVADVTRGPGIPTTVSLNPLMVDGTGMCGGCRVRVGGESRFACVDGPEFNAHEVDFELLIQRNRAYADQERTSLEAWEETTCRARAVAEAAEATV